MILLLSFLSGVVALLHEVLWGRMITLAVGGPLAAFTIVVASFMAGLSTGALYFGWHSDRKIHPLRTFSWLQVILAGAGVLAPYAGEIVRYILTASGSEPGDTLFLVIEVGVTATLCAGPAFVMGGTLPLLLASYSAGDRSLRTRACGLIAGANTAGAAVGSLAAGFLILPLAGLANSFRMAALVSLLVAVCARLIPESSPPIASKRSPERATGGPSPMNTWQILTLLFISGMAITSYEVAWARLSFLSFGSSVQAASLVLGAVITGLAAGNALGARLGRSVGSGRGLLTWLIVITPLAALLIDPLLARMPLAAAMIEQSVSGTPFRETSAGLLQTVQFILLTLTLFVPCLSLGAAFPLGFKVLHAPAPGSTKPLTAGHAAGLAAAASSLGNLIGAPAAYALLTTAAGSREVLLGTSLSLCLAGLVLGSGRTPRLVSLVAIPMTLLMGILVPWNPDLLSSGPYLYGALYAASGSGATLNDVLATRGTLIEVQDGPHALVTVRRAPDGVLSMQVNGKTDASTGGDMKTQVLTTQLPLIIHASSREAPPRNLLLVGLGSGVSAGSALTHGVGTTVVELSPGVAEAASLFDEANGRALSSPRLKLIIGDARSWLLFGNRDTTDGYDVIASQPSNPWVAGEASLFTVEFFELARRRLATGGIMCQWIQGYGLDPADFRSVVATFASVFNEALLFEESTAGGDYLLIGSELPIGIDPERVSAIMKKESIEADLGRVEVKSSVDLLSLLVMNNDAIRTFVTGSPLQTEDRLALEFTAAKAMRRDTLGAILEVIESNRVEPATLAAQDSDLAGRLSVRSRQARREREWARGLGLLTTHRMSPMLMKGISYLRGGMNEHALRTVRSVVASNPDEPLPRLLLAHITMNVGRTEEATRELATFVAFHPEDPRGRLFLSRALFATGKPLEALVHNEQLRVMAPDMAEAASDQCAILLLVEDIPSAEAACRDAIHLDADLPAANANLGLVMKRRARWDEAEKLLTRAIELDPELDDARYNLASLLDQLARPDEGLETLNPLLSAPSTDSESLTLAARMALAAGRPALARGYIERSLMVEPGSREALELARRISEESGHQGGQ